MPVTSAGPACGAARERTKTSSCPNASCRKLGSGASGALDVALLAPQFVLSHTSQLFPTKSCCAAGSDVDVGANASVPPPMPKQKSTTVLFDAKDAGHQGSCCSHRSADEAKEGRRAVQRGRAARRARPARSHSWPTSAHVAPPSPVRKKTGD